MKIHLNGTILEKKLITVNTKSMITIKKTGLLFLSKKLIGLRKEKEEVEALDINILGIEEYLYFRSKRHL